MDGKFGGRGAEGIVHPIKVKSEGKSDREDEGYVLMWRVSVCQT